MSLSRIFSHARLKTRRHLTAALLRRPCVVSGKQYSVPRTQHSGHRNLEEAGYASEDSAVIVAFAFAFASHAGAEETRHFYVSLWIYGEEHSARRQSASLVPCRPFGPYQEVKVVSASGDLPLKKTRESKNGNEIYFAETSKAKQMELHFEVVYDVVRHERLTFGVCSPHLEALKLSDKERKEYLAPDELVPVTGLPADLAVKVTEGKTSPLG